MVVLVNSNDDLLLRYLGNLRDRRLPFLLKNLVDLLLQLLMLQLVVRGRRDESPWSAVVVQADLRAHLVHHPRPFLIPDQLELVRTIDEGLLLGLEVVIVFIRRLLGLPDFILSLAAGILHYHGFLIKGLL